MNCKEQIEIDLKAHFDKKSSGLFQFTGWESQNPERGLGGLVNLGRIYRGSCLSWEDLGRILTGFISLD